MQHSSPPQSGTYGRRPTPLEYRRFRVRTPLRSFRDLEVYKSTTHLAAALFTLKLPKENTLLVPELALLRDIGKQVPKAIAESYGDKFADRLRAYAKLEAAMTYITGVIAKLDFLLASLTDQTTKEFILALLKKYQAQKLKVLNLKRAWERVKL